MEKLPDAFATGLFDICRAIMQGIGIIDDLLSAAMNLVGVVDPASQLYIILVVCVALVVLVLRALGWFFGWSMFLLMALLLLHRIVPGT
jgi:hypothetical protein